MFFLKEIYFKKKIYPAFYQNLSDARKEDSAVIFMEVVDELLTIMVIINFNVVIFKKRIDSPLIIEKLTFPAEILKVNNDLYSLISKTKYNATKVKNHAFIETFSEMINKVKILYKIYGEQQHNIWNEIFSLEPSFFISNGEINLPVGQENKWVD